MYELVVTFRGIPKWTGEGDYLSFILGHVDPEKYINSVVKLQERITFQPHKVSDDPSISVISTSRGETLADIEWARDYYVSIIPDWITEFPNLNISFEINEVT